MKYIRVEGEIAFVALSRGQEAIVDAADVGLVINKSWHAIPNPMGGFYARSNDGQYMHRLITGCPKSKEVDHVNHSTLDNRRQNLRAGSHKDNMANGKFALTTHCPKGHIYDEANTYRNKKGKRICRACNAERVGAIYSRETLEQREQRRIRAKADYEKNRERRRQQMQKYMAAHKNERREYDRRRREHAAMPTLTERNPMRGNQMHESAEDGARQDGLDR